MTRRSLKMATIGLVGFITFSALAYVIVSNTILISCKTLLYMFENPVYSIIFILNLMALGFLINTLYNKYKKN